MAVYKIFPTKDATIYSRYPSLNTGLDEIIEATTTALGVTGSNANPQTSRFLVKFSSNEMNNIINNKISGADWDVYFKAYHAKITGLNLSSSLELHPISGSWGMGTGRYKDFPKVTNGVNWGWRQYSGSEAWQDTGFPTNVTASYSGSNLGGGNWYFISGSSQSFSYSDPLDITMNVTNAVTAWYNGTIINDGFIIKQSDSDEFVQSVEREATFRFFSIDTNTIYPPQLEFRWDDYNWNTGSSTNTIISTSDLVITSPNNSGTFYSESIQRFKINVRPKYPTREFQTSSIYTTNYYLPTSSCYAIKDHYTNEYVIDFDSTYTKISADDESNYFDIYMNGLEPERYYTILVKTIVNNTTLVLDEKIYFKVIN